ISAIAVDAAGSAYVTGTTNSASFPTTAGAYQAGVTGGGSFVAKLAPGGSSLAYSTYVLNATPTALAVDGAGNAYLTGIAFSTFATTPGAFQPTYKGEPGGTNALVASLNATGTGMRYATFLGGSSSDAGNGIAVDASGNAVVGGDTTSTDFPRTAQAYQPTIGGKTDGFVTKMNATGTGLLFSTYFGGALTDRITGVAMDLSGAVYVVGSTYSANLPIRNAFQPVKSGRNLVNSSLGNVFVAKLQPGGDALAYASFLGGEVCVHCQSSFGLQEYAADSGMGIAVDATAHAYITGLARSYTFPLLNSLIQNQGRDQELQNSAFVAKIGSAGNSVLYNTITTTDADQQVFAVAVDPAGNAYGAGTAMRPGLGGSIDLVAPGSFSPTPKPGNPTSALVYKLASGAPSMTLTASLNPSTSQAPVTLTARVADTGLNGTVLFFDGHMLLGSAQLASGTAAFTTPLWPGVRRLTAVLRAPDVATDTALLYQVVNPSLVCH
ncbi:MAG: SBBP repeat-containing protein, partial [Pseudomonadota bacterium]